MTPPVRNGSIIAAMAWCAVLVLPFIMFHDVTRRMLSVWLQIGAYSHGPLMAGMAVLLIMQALGGPSAAADDRPALAGLVALFAGAVALVVSHRLQFETGAYAALPWLVFALIWSIGGWDRARASLVGVTLLLLAVPVWDPLATVLQHISVAAVSTIMAATSTPIFVEGVFIHIPEGVFAVETGCSGIAYFIVAVGLALFITGRDGAPLRDSVKLCAQFASLAIVTNWVRISALIALGRMTDMQSPLIYDHYMFGWLLFAAVILPAIWLNSRSPKIKLVQLGTLPPLGPNLTRLGASAAMLSLLAFFS